MAAVQICSVLLVFCAAVNGLLEPEMISVVVPECVMKCARPLVGAVLMASLADSNFTANFDGVCEEYRRSVICVAASASSECESTEVFDILTSGIHYSCIEHKREFEELYACLGNNTQLFSFECSEKCNITGVKQEMDQMSRSAPQILRSFDGPETKAIVDNIRQRLDMTCRGTNCTMTCLESEVEQQCPGFGGLYLKSLHLPFESIGRFLKDIRSQSLRDFLAVAMPDSCWEMMAPITVPDVQQEPSLGDFFRQEISLFANFTENIFASQGEVVSGKPGMIAVGLGFLVSLALAN